MTLCRLNLFMVSLVEDKDRKISPDIRGEKKNLIIYYVLTVFLLFKLDHWYFQIARLLEASEPCASYVCFPDGAQKTVWHVRHIMNTLNGFVNQSCGKV